MLLVLIFEYLETAVGTTCLRGGQVWVINALRTQPLAETPDRRVIQRLLRQVDVQKALE